MSLQISEFPRFETKDDARMPAAPRIEPVPSSVARPMWSVMIPTYNCARYLRKTLESVLAQDRGPKSMQIEVVDDCSTEDDPEAVVAEFLKVMLPLADSTVKRGAIGAPVCIPLLEFTLN